MGPPAGVKFLQTSLSSQPETVGSYKAGAADIIRGMLREQKRECEILHSNPLFREFKEKARRQGMVHAPLEHGPVPEDGESDARIRTLELIAKVALRDSRDQSGVWSSFGKPYVCLGKPEQLASALPKLHRDDMNEQTQTLKATKGPKQIIRAKYPKRGISPPKNHEHSKKEIEKDMLMKKLSVMKFSSIDYLEAKFPGAPIQLAAKRKSKAMWTPLPALDRIEPKADPSEFGVLPGKPSFSTSGNVRANSAPLDSNHPSEDFSCSASPRPYSVDCIPAILPPSFRLADSASNGRFETDSLTADADVKQSSFELEGLAQMATPPVFSSLTRMARPGLLDRDNPVYRWHNDFLEVRHIARKGLQHALWERVQWRKKATGSPTLQRGVSRALISRIESRTGDKSRPKELPGQGVLPSHPWKKGMRFLAPAQVQDSKPVVERLSPRNKQDVQLVECFYKKLCYLVEGLKQSDPLSLMVVKQTKDLLEEGQTLHRPLLRKIMEHVSEFVHSCNIVKYNRYLLHIFTFIGKCVGINDVELKQMSRIFNLLPILYTSEDADKGNDGPQSHPTPNLEESNRAQVDSNGFEILPGA